VTGGDVWGVELRGGPLRRPEGQVVLGEDGSERLGGAWDCHDPEGVRYGGDGMPQARSGSPDRTGDVYPSWRIGSRVVED
jgi:hypothetical protein